MNDIRIGQGFDVHRLVQGRDLWLGGVKIPFDKGLLGHSDADVLTHAVCDAVLGAAGMGDIGRHFPDTDPKWKGASGEVIATKTSEIIRSKGWRVISIDVVLIAEAPKIASYVDEMRSNIGSWLDVDPAAVGIKGTSTEGLGFTGRGEGIAAMAVALLSRS